MNWYIGQRVVAVRNHVDGRFKKGDEFIIKGLKQTFCKCNIVLIDVGFTSAAAKIQCNECNTRVPSDGTHWFSERRFAPLDTRPELSETTYEDIMQEIETKELQTV